MKQAVSILLALALWLGTTATVWAEERSADADAEASASEQADDGGAADEDAEQPSEAEDGEEFEDDAEPDGDEGSAPEDDRVDDGERAAGAGSGSGGGTRGRAAGVGDEAQTQLTLTVEEPDNQPSFLITIPNEVELDAWQPTTVTVEASEVQNLDGARISVQWGGTQHSGNMLVLNGVDHNRTLCYLLNDAQGGLLVDTKPNGNVGEGLIGTELVGFEADGAASYQVEIRAGQGGYIDPEPVVGLSYTGTVTYIIALVE